MANDLEVARLELDDKSELNPDFAEVPKSADGFLEIALIEVAASARGQGLGTAVVEALTRRFEGRNLAAYSEEADGFWASLGWFRYIHATSPAVFRPLYVSMH